LTLEQKERMNGNREPETYQVAIRDPAERFSITIGFPGAIRASDFDVIVLNQQKEMDILEVGHCKSGLQVSELTRTARFAVAKPLVGHTYGLSWQLPSLSSERQPTLDPLIEGRAKLIQELLLESNPIGVQPSPVGEKLNEAFRQIYAEILGKYGDASVDESLEVSLSVFDPNLRQFRIVSGMVREENRDWKALEGEGIIGRASKLNSALLYVRSLVDPEMDWYAMAPGTKGPHEAVFAVPVRFPIDRADGWVIGVICLASTSTASRILSLHNNPKEQNEIIRICHEEFLAKKMLPVLGVQFPATS